MKSRIFAHWGFLLIIFTILVFNHQVILKGFSPSPLDGMIGLYHPFRDLYAPDYPNGIPYKNFLLTDPFRQLIVWKDLAIDIYKAGSLPLWNPYEMAGKPLLGNFQSGAMYPLNVIFLFFPFTFSWSLYIITAQLIGGISMYFYLGVLKKNEITKALGSIVFIFSGFFVAWYEWGNVSHAFAWFPLALLIIERCSTTNSQKLKHILLKGLFLGIIFSLSFLAGHPQTTLYLIAFSMLYLLWVIRERIVLKVGIFSSALVTFLVLCGFQVYQGVQFVANSLRGKDQVFSNSEGWFIPYQNLVQFFAPDFFGNPSTLNYWGVFNYAEFVGYIGVPFLFLAFYSVFSKRDRRFYFALSLVILTLIFATHNIVSLIPYHLSIPVISSMQPTRLVGFMSFGMLMLSLFGFDELQNKKNIKQIVLVCVLCFLLIVSIWGISLLNIFGIDESNLAISKRNLILPSLLLLISCAVFVVLNLVNKNKFHFLKKGILVFLLIIVVFDLIRFANKFTPFSDQKYFYPETSAIHFIQKNIGEYRILSLDDRILAPNITTFYGIQNVGGYDPLYLKNFAELIVASERQSNDLRQPYGFNRIISPKNIDSEIIDLLGVKYVLSLGDVTSQKFKLVATEGSTKVYENENVFNRAFFVSEVRVANTTDEILKTLLSAELSEIAIVKSDSDFVSSKKFQKGKVRSYELTENGSKIAVENNSVGFLVVSDSYYPLVKAYIDGVETEIYETNHALRGVIVPKGSRIVEFKASLF